jgi:hypothetical protein
VTFSSSHVPCLFVFVCVVMGAGQSFAFRLIPENQGRGAYCSLHCSHIGTFVQQPVTAECKWRVLSLGALCSASCQCCCYTMHWARHPSAACVTQPGNWAQSHQSGRKHCVESAVHAAAAFTSQQCFSSVRRMWPSVHLHVSIPQCACSLKFVR